MCYSGTELIKRKSPPFFPSQLEGVADPRRPHWTPRDWRRVWRRVGGI